jgi:hypothetical protein
MSDLEMREFLKDQHLRQEEEPGLEDVVRTVSNIYQSEAGHMIEDEETYDALLSEIAAHAARLSVEIKDNEKLVDRILEEMADDDAAGDVRRQVN